jgi:hypothetical protein
MLLERMKKRGISGFIGCVNTNGGALVVAQCSSHKDGGTMSFRMVTTIRILQKASNPGD